MRAQALNENKTFPTALQRLIEEYSMSVKAPEGGRIHVVRVPVNPGREWQEAVNTAGPDTGKDWDIRKVAGLYPPQQGETSEKEIILVNFGKSSSQHALDWAKPLGLRPVAPRGIFAVGEHQPKLNEELGMPYMAVVSLEECSFEGRRHVPYVWWNESGRRAHLDWFGSDWNDDYWVAFSRGSSDSGH